MYRTCTFLFVFVVSIFLASPARAAEELSLFAWSEYVPQEVIEGFTKETGIKVDYQTYGSNEEMLVELKAGNKKFDLIQPSEYMIEALRKANLLAELDKSRISNLKNIDPKFLNLPHDPEQRYSIPWMAGTVGIVYNAEKIKDPMRGYKDAFQKKHARRIVAVADAREILAWAMRADGKSVNDVSPEDLARAKLQIAQWVPLVSIWDSDSPKTALLNGDVDIGIIWSGEAALCWQADKKFKYVLPVEGAHMYIDSLAIPANAPHKDSATRFMNYILRPEVSKRISDKFPYTNPNAEARKLLTEEQRANPASYPPESRGIEYFRDIGPVTAEIEKMIDDLRSKEK